MHIENGRINFIRIYNFIHYRIYALRRSNTANFPTIQPRRRACFANCRYDIFNKHFGDKCRQTLRKLSRTTIQNSPLTVYNHDRGGVCLPRMPSRERTTLKSHIHQRQVPSFSAGIVPSPFFCGFRTCRALFRKCHRQQRHFRK